MTDKENKDTALLNYISVILDVSIDFSEEILSMYLEKKSVGLIIDYVKDRFDRIMQEMLNEKLQ